MMAGSLVSLVVGAAFLATHMVATALLCRLRLGVPAVLRHIASAAVMLLAVLAGLALIAAVEATPIPAWPAVAVLYGGAVLWLFAYSALSKSISLSVLAALARSPGERVGQAVIAEALVMPRFEERVAVLAGSGLVESTSQGHRITPRGRRAVAILGRMHSLCGIERSGLYNR